MEKITFGSGCFWCTEAVFQSVKGVDSVISGYMGGHTLNPTYKEICTGSTNHAEVVQLNYDPEIVSFEELLLIFFKTHDATTLNRQGNDVGTQYRSVIFYHTDHQKEQAEQMIAHLYAQHVYETKIVTVIEEASTFYPAEIEHQNYYSNNYRQPYCIAVIQPKLQKFATLFLDKIKPELLS